MLSDQDPKRKRTKSPPSVAAPHAAAADTPEYAGVARRVPGVVFRCGLDGAGRLTFPVISRGSDPRLHGLADRIESDANGFFDSLAPFDFRSILRHSAAALSLVETVIHIDDDEDTRISLRANPLRLGDGQVVWDGVIVDASKRPPAGTPSRLNPTGTTTAAPMPHLPNTLIFLDRLNSRLADTRHLPRALLSIDLDRFSVVGTAFGRVAADRVLATLAERMQALLAPSDMLARIGGDHFLVALSGWTDADDLANRVRGLAAVIEQPIEIENTALEVTACIGYSTFPDLCETADHLLTTADIALRVAKDYGRGIVFAYTTSMAKGDVSNALQLQRQMRVGLARNEFIPFFQPLYDLTNGRLIGMEALCRWISKLSSGDAEMTPAQFIPIAEECGLIDQLFEQMLWTSARHCADWHAAGLPVVPIAINVSGQQFHRPHRLIAILETVIRETGLPPHLIELELTESSAMGNADSAASILETLRQMGIICAIDDFGTGYSSLAVLKRFPLRKLKIDRSFIQDVTTDSDGAAIVQAIVAMAHALRLMTLAEGVELPEQADFLRGTGCDQVQGFLYGRPIPADAMRDLLVAQAA